MKDKRRALEWGKNLVILLLSISALYLLTMTPLVQDSGILSWGAADQQGGQQQGSTVTLTAASRPARIALTLEEGRYGLQYDREQVDELFARLSPMLGEGLVSAASPAAISESQWRRYLAARSVYFDFDGQIPLSALGQWLSQDGSCELSASARRLLLAEEGQGVLLCYQDEESGRFYACETGLDTELHFQPVFENMEGNGALFAFEDGELDTLLAPYTLITGGKSGGAVYTVSNPISGSDVSGLLSALSFSGQNHASGSSGEFYLDGEDRLQISADGTVTYRAAGAGKYPVQTQSETATAAEAIEAARSLAEAVRSAYSGAERLYLTSAEAEGDGYRVQMCYRLDGSRVHLRDEGWAAEFLIRDNAITEFTLHIRTYTATAEVRELLPIGKAAVMLPDLGARGLELEICYQDRGESRTEPVWVAN